MTQLEQAVDEFIDALVDARRKDEEEQMRPAPWRTMTELFAPVYASLRRWARVRLAFRDLHEMRRAAREEAKCSTMDKAQIQELIDSLARVRLVRDAGDAKRGQP